MPAEDVARWQQLEVWYRGGGKERAESAARLEKEVAGLKAVVTNLRSKSDVVRLQSHLDRAGEEILRLREQVQRMGADLAKAREDARQANERAQLSQSASNAHSLFAPPQGYTNASDAWHAPSSVPPPPFPIQHKASPSQAAAPGLGGEAARVAMAFVTWCHAGGGVVGREAIFGSTHGFTVTSVYRDCNAAALVLSDQPMPDPAEYWLVATGGQTWLLPQPINAHQFREIDARCFDGGATPARLSSFKPAQVEARGATYHILSKGSLTPG